MKFSRTFGLIACFLGLSLFEVRAQAPDSLAGWTVYSMVTAGTSPFSGSGSRYTILFSDTGTTFQVRDVYDVTDSSGTISYQKTGANTGTANYVDQATGAGFTQTLTFTSATSGSYQIQGSGGTQSVNFIAFGAIAPVSISQKIFKVSVLTGTYPFQTSGSYRIITKFDLSYLSFSDSGGTDGSGYLNYTKANRSCGEFNFLDDDFEIGFGKGGLAFSGPTNGFIWLTKSGFDYQVGNFTMEPLIAPTITVQPASKTVNLGASVTFSATVKGTGPFTYQWRKIVDPIPVVVATTPTYVISSVQAHHAGSYHLSVDGPGGGVGSSSAVLTVNCGQTISSASAAFNFNGGSGTVTVSSVECPWTAVSSAGWITIQSGSSGTGNGVVSYSVAANNSTLPRNGTITIAGKTFTVAQGPQFAPSNLRGKTLVMSIGSGSGTLPASGKYLVSTRSGTNNFLQIIPLAGTTAATSAAYNSSRGGATVSYFSYNGITTALTFADPVSGTFNVSKSDGSQTGTFVMENKTPDINGDARPDLIWQNASTRGLSAWLMSGTNWMQNAALPAGKVPPLGWKALGSADFNSDGQSDILFQTSTSALNVWLMSRTNLLKSLSLRPAVLPGTNQVAVSAADFNGDGQPDILFQDTAGKVSLWIFYGTNYSNTISVRGGQSAGVGWRAMAAADFNRDRQTDILFQNTNGAIALWLMNGPGFVSSVGFFSAPVISSTWKIAGGGDFNLDGYNDVLWQNSDGKLMGWLMNGRGYVGHVVFRNNQAFSSGLKLVGPK